MDILSSGMLMQEAEVRSSAGQHVRSHSSKNVAVFCKCVRSQLKCVRTQHCTAYLSEGPVLARRRVMSVRSCANVLGLAAMRSTARPAFDRTVGT
jgi:hypothetical protein